MTILYTPILRWKRGERIGLQNLNPHSKTRSNPLLVIENAQYDGKKATKNRAAMTAAEVVVSEMSKIGGYSHFKVDASRLTSPLANHPLTDIAAEARSAGLDLVPATSLSASPLYQAAVISCIQTDQNGVCVRIDHDDAENIAQWMPVFPFNPAETDLIIDYSVNINLPAHTVNALINIFRNVMQIAQWRTVTIAGTSMPQNFQGYAQGLHTIQRQEYNLWQQLSASNLPYQLEYGDHASVNPESVTDGITWGFPINVRYTLVNEFLICRGVRTDGPMAIDMGIQLRQHADNILNYANRHRLNCWSDDKIDNIANGTASPQALEHWVQLGVNRHIELMHDILP